jgi:membrane protein
MRPLRAILVIADRIDKTVRRQGDYWNERSNGFVGVLWRTGHNFSQRGTWEASALSYYSLLSLFPLLMILIVVLGQIVGPSTTGTQLRDFLSIFLPGTTALELSRTIQRFADQASSISLIVAVTFIWSALGLFSALSGALDRIFRTPKNLKFWQRRIVGFLIVLALGVLLLANIITSVLFNFLDLLFLNQSNVWVQIAGLFIPFGFSMGIFAMSYRWIPQTFVPWDAIWPAALIGAMAWELAKIFFGIWLDTIADLTLVYGSISTVIVFMIWAWYTWAIVLLCGEFCMELSLWLALRREANPAPESDFAGDYYLQQLQQTSLPLLESQPLSRGELPSGN